MLSLERESEIERGCLYQLGLPRRVVPGEGFEPSLDLVFSFSFRHQLALLAHPPAQWPGGVCVFSVVSVLSAICVIS